MKVLIFGQGKSGKSAYNFLKKKNVKVEFAKEEDLNSVFLEKDYLDRLFEGLSFAVVSPGIKPDNYLIGEAEKRKVKLVCEFDLGANDIKSDIIAVTGTNGKTTTVSLINFLLLGAGKKTFLGGNIGFPVTSFSDETKDDDIVVLECSSFQLFWSKNFHPHISAILNITPDHLSWHKKLQNYIKCKQKIASKLSKDDFLLINADDELLMKNLPKTRGKIFYFSTKQKVCGCFVEGDSIYFYDNCRKKKLASLVGIKLIGKHNLSNILCAVLAVYLETGDKSIFKNLKYFEGIEHRIEYVGQARGVLFYNDSKATNIASTLVALSSFSCGINLILGGSEKGYDFDELFAKIPKNVKNIAVFGQTKPSILASAKKFNFLNIFPLESLNSCVNLCFKLSEPKDVVLLSPASASFDQFSNFEERGNVFKKIAKEIILNETTLFESEEKTQI